MKRKQKICPHCKEILVKQFYGMKCAFCDYVSYFKRYKTTTGDVQMKKAFTLIELLVVIGIIALLLGIIIPSYNNVMEKAKVTKTKAEVKNLETAFKNYLDMYRVWPADWMDGEIGGSIFFALRGENPNGDNPQHIAFYEFSGTNSPDVIKAYDPWADPNSTVSERDMHAYQVVFDKDYNNTVSIGGQELRRSVVVWSPGKNGIDERGEGDDVTSWK